MLVLYKNLLFTVGNQRPKGGKKVFNTHQATNAESRSFWFKNEDSLNFSYAHMIHTVRFTDAPHSFP